MNNPIIIIAGPTASGKTDLAINIAENGNFEVINADAMQIYQDIPIISAQPSLAERKSVPHWILGNKRSDLIYSAALWAEEATTIIRDIHKRNKIPLIVGGTGLYIKALIDGLSQIPTIDEKIRNEARELYSAIGQENFYSALIKIDNKIIGKILPTDTQRMIRAFEVFKQTGRSIIDLQVKPALKSFSDESFLFINTDIERSLLHKKINDRFIQMLDQGALEEVEHILKHYNSPILSITKAHGVPELSDYLLGKSTLETAINRAQTITRQYAKRQSTWFRHQLKNIQQINMINMKDVASIITLIESFIKKIN